ncbi:cupredoxin domain-containing protein [Oceanobacillus saliphilus]|uniref:cupredoxin domain-containing protein n=1 Tax=Oceanobacillus saliphilus TaxID=2925834 RepID=UPI00201DD53A|nr:cupredoxin domain-containing protein [Oceanobacillus saliphilus]
MKKSLLVALFLSLILVLAACGGDDSGTDAGVDNSTEETESSSSSEETASNNEIEINASNFEFDQAEYTVNAGEEVKLSLVNVEGMHGIGIDDLDVSIEGDGEVVFTPEEPGEYTIYCNIPCGQGHNDMVSTLIVQ